MKAEARSRRIYDRWIKKLRRGTAPRDLCRHPKADGSPCLCPGSPVVLDPDKPTRLAWACRVHRNAVKVFLGLRVYRKANMKFRRRYRVLPRVKVFQDITVEEWLIKYPNLRPLSTPCSSSTSTKCS